MKKKISLKLLLSMSIIVLVFVMVLAYSVLSAHFFIRGMDSIMSANMEREVLTLTETEFSSTTPFLVTPNNFTIARDWHNLPSTITQSMTPPTSWNQLEKHDDSGWFSSPQHIHFVMHYKNNGDSIWITQSISRANTSVMIKDNAGRSIKELWIFGSTLLVLFGLIIWLINRQVTRPIDALWHWAQSLRISDNLNKPIPNFTYPELNKMADLIQGSMLSVHKSVEREHQFLRHTSHELRTPISVIRSNIELFRKVESKSPDTLHICAPMIDRIDRASLTMKHLTETLLWLNKEDTTALPTNNFRLSDVIKPLVTEMDYLLKNKPVSVSIDTDDTEVSLPEITTRIVIGNLIRNAFQHTWEGSVIIQQKNDTITITNDLTIDEDHTEDLGFGLGLQLIQLLTKRFNWLYAVEKTKNYYRVTVQLCDYD